MIATRPSARCLTAVTCVSISIDVVADERASRRSTSSAGVSHRASVVERVGRDAELAATSAPPATACAARRAPLRSPRCRRVAALARHQLGEIDREAERVVETERVVAADRAADLRAALRGARRRELVEPSDAAIDRREEALLLGARRVRGCAARAASAPGYTSPIVSMTVCDHEHERRLPAAEQPRVTHRAPKDSAQHVAAPVVRRKHAVRQQERDRARMVRDHAERRGIDRVRRRRPNRPSRRESRRRCAVRRSRVPSSRSRPPARPPRSAARRGRCG